MIQKNEIDIRLSKPGAHHYVQLFTDPDDPHFIIIEVRKNSDGLLARSHYIIENDLAQWQRRFEDQGFVVTIDLKR